jgi:hypothetical protein
MDEGTKKMGKKAAEEMKKKLPTWVGILETLMIRRPKAKRARHAWIIGWRIC